jgi:hypothetical protein
LKKIKFFTQGNKTYLFIYLFFIIFGSSQVFLNWVFAPSLRLLPPVGPSNPGNPRRASKMICSLYFERRPSISMNADLSNLTSHYALWAFKGLLAYGKWS